MLVGSCICLLTWTTGLCQFGSEWDPWMTELPILGSLLQIRKNLRLPFHPTELGSLGMGSGICVGKAQPGVHLHIAVWEALRWNAFGQVSPCGRPVPTAEERKLTMGPHGMPSAAKGASSLWGWVLVPGWDLFQILIVLLCHNMSFPNEHLFLWVTDRQIDLPFIGSSPKGPQQLARGQTEAWS